MDELENYRFAVETEHGGTASSQAGHLADTFREISGVVSSERTKGDYDTQDLGTIVTVVASSGAALTLARGLADWLRLRRGTKLIFESTEGYRKLKIQLEHIDPEVASRLVEAVRE